MKSLVPNKRSKAILGIVIFAIGIGLISLKVISYQSGGCIKSAQEMTLNKSAINYLFL